jgi:protein MAK11
MHYTSLSEDVTAAKDIFAISTEDGRILFYSTALTPASKRTQPGSQPHIPICEAIGQLGGAGEGLTGRIKDFEILKTINPRILLIVTGSSDGAIRLWLLDEAELTDISSVLQWPEHGSEESKAHASNDKRSNATITQVGSLLGTYEAGNRITCLKAFVMSDPEQYKAHGLVEGNNANRANGLEGKEDSNPSS